ncbi:oxidation resistance protein 1 isoform X6 [Ascaphus truei]|uniref:oxidation resistance protein 1 isoform X6 n=1 Tax=Ascaphus truei TaxID=8439 RepID=UPI003F599E30
MEYLTNVTGKGGRVLRGTANRLWVGLREVHFQDYLRETPLDGELHPLPSSDTGQKKTLEKKDGRRMSFQKPKGTTEYTVESRDSLNSIALKFDTTPNKLVQLNKLFSRAVVPGQLFYVPDPDYISSVESSPSLSPISPLSPTSSEVEFEKSTDAEGHHHKESTSSPAYTSIRPSRVVSSTSEEEEAFTEKFLKINCKYITDGKGTVSGVLLVTPNNIMFDPHKTDPLVQENGCEEYGIMCPTEEVTSAAMYKEIADSKLKDSIPVDVEQLSCMREFCHFKKISHSTTNEMDAKTWDAGNDSASTAPRSTEESLSEDVFTESELSPIREELLSSDELRQDKSSGASSESVQTINQTDVECSGNISDFADVSCDVKGSFEPPGNDSGFLSHVNDFEKGEKSLSGVEGMDKRLSGSTAILAQTNEDNMERAGSQADSKEEESSSNIEHEIRDQNLYREEATTDNQTKETGKEEPPPKTSLGDSETEVEELRKLWKNLTMQQAKQQRENLQHTTQKEPREKISATETPGEGICSAVAKEKRRHRSHKYLCLRVGKPMRKTFVSHASASMQQYAQRDKKLEYWFAVPHDRTDHLYSFFIQWSPDIYAEETGESTREPGFVVVKKNEELDTANDSAVRLWEVVSVAEYHRRIDALNTEELRTLCRRLKITTREEVNPKQATSIRTDLEPESFRPNLSDPSELLQVDQIEKLTKHLPPRTIGYPWTLVYSTAKHGMSLKTLYRTMLGLDTPVLLVIKDSDSQIFGALASEPFKVSDCFYGTGETFLFTFCPDFEVFKWTGDNMFFIKGDMDSLAFGGGGGEFALWLDGDLYHGRSHTCKTFENPTLSKKEDFIVQDIEIWAFE